MTSRLPKGTRRARSARVARSLAAWSWVVLCGALSIRGLQAQPPPAEESPGEVAAQPELPEIPETRVEAQRGTSAQQPLSDETVVTPSRRETEASESGSSFTVINEQQIRETRAVSVLEVLRGVVGVDVVQSGGPGRAASVFMRGANSEHTKLLLDGIPLNDPSGATRAFDFSALMLDNIERIEVVRGPQSTLYGSDAIGGVINIITKRGEGPLSGTVGGMGGSFGTHQERVGLSGGNDAVNYSFGASYLDTDGIRAVDRRFAAPEKDPYTNATFSGRFGWTPNQAFNVDYIIRYTDADSDIDDFLADNLLRENRLQQFANRVQITSLLLDGDIFQKVGFSLVDYNRIDTDPGFFGVPEFNGQTRQIDYQADLRLTENNTLTAGFDYLQEEASSTILPQASQNLSGVYLQDSFSIWDRSFTTVGVRWDDHSTAGDANTYRLTQLFRIQETGTRIHGSIGRGFRAPAIAQRFGIVGNPALRPEFSKGWDVGLTQDLFRGKVTVDGTYYRNDFVDLIVFDPTLPGPFGGALNNVARARVSGVEATARWQVANDTDLRVSYTLTDSLDLVTDAPLLRRPRDKASFSLHHRFLCDKADINLYAVYIGPRRDFGTVALTTLRNYVTVNLSGSYRPAEHWQLFFRAENLLDEDYEEVFGFETPGLSGYAGVNLLW